MTINIEIQIEELRAELRNASDAGERRQIQAELERARTELEAVIARQVENTAQEAPS
ncbi:hypothetical protein [Neorhizobium alkalisoli]|jgi:hypothetical protein|uniref:Uncharacterized protein n=1 Tax=Neorhizobium alkalisoli TaxID=528178 RepID=A0A561PZB0_9HYPH|nr:hypothetical protein [Neorhizobium alkalisoli]TWF43457.1 hypothetical protein FHW37_11930 [Neorhizobium alkalisoli]